MKSKVTVFLILCMISTAHSAIITVNATHGLIDINDGVCSISEAIINANNDAATHGDCAAGDGDDTIILTSNITLTTEYENTIVGRIGTPAINSAIVLNGDGFTLERDSGLDCDLDGMDDPGEFRLLRIATNGNVDLQNTVLQNGCADGSGSSPRNGGGLLNQGTLAIHHSVFSNNQARTNGGGIENNGLGAVISVIQNSTFSGNSANSGGVIYNRATIISIQNSTFSWNSAPNGGGIYSTGTITSIQNSTFSGNSASLGGGIYNNSGTISSIQNSTFSGNSANFGGGIYNDFGNINSIQNSLFHDGSTCMGSGGSIGGNNNMADATSDGCPVLATPLTTASVGPLADNGCTTPLADGSCVMTHALLVGSEAIDLGDGNAIANDQRGYAANGTRDIGAYEFDAITDLIFRQGFE